MPHNFAGLSGMAIVAAGLVSADIAAAEVVSVNSGASLRQLSSNRKNIKMVAGITSSKDLPSQDLIEARKALTKRGRVANKRLRALADLGDGYAAHIYAERLAEKGRAKLAADTAHYYSISAATGRGYSIHGMVAAMDQIDPKDTSAARLKNLKNVLMAYASAGNADAVEAVLRYHFAKVPFGDLTGDIDIILDKSAVGAGPVSLQLASSLMQAPSASHADLAQAKDYLLTASHSASFSISLTAQNLLPIVEARLAQTPEQPLKEGSQ